MEFINQKIRLDTLGEYLAEIRLGLNLDILDVSKKTAISKDFILELEKGNYSKLPADVYVIGFLKQLSVVYRINSEQLIQQYKKEKSIHSHLQKTGKEKTGNKIINKLKNIAITPKIISLTIGIFLVTVSFVYIIWQVVSLSKSPSLVVDEPVQNKVYQASFLSVKGKTDIGSFVTVNDQPVFVDEMGSFKTQIGVDQGPKDIVVVSKNRFEKITKKTIPVSIEFSDEKKVDGVMLVLKFKGDVVVKYQFDENKIEEKQFKVNEVLDIKAKNKIIVSVSNAGMVDAELNNQNLGVLGRDGEVLNNLKFTDENLKSYND